jgi:hypothetical protein
MTQGSGWEIRAVVIVQRKNADFPVCQEIPAKICATH